MELKEEGKFSTDITAPIGKFCQGDSEECHASEFAGEGESDTNFAGRNVRFTSELFV
jgi:hypothetical protein